MRELTNSERDFLLAYWFTEPLNNSIALPERFKEGFVAGLDFSAALTAAPFDEPFDPAQDVPFDVAQGNLRTQLRLAQDTAETLQQQNEELSRLIQRQGEAIQALTAISERRAEMITQLMASQEKLETESDALRALIGRVKEIGPDLTFKWPMNQPSDLLINKLQQLLADCAAGEN